MRSILRQGLSLVLAVCVGLLAGCSSATAPQAAQPSTQSGQSSGQTTQTSGQTTQTSGQTTQTTQTPAQTAPTATDSSQPPASCSGTPTPAQTEGPYYSAGAPERTSLVESGMQGTQLVLTGYVFDQNCKPVANALVEFWQADDNGKYDNQGYTLRGGQHTDSAGRYSVETIVPGIYPGRTRHIHVKVAAPNQPVLTTQLYFPDEAGNAKDGIFRPESVINVTSTGTDSMTATYNFVLAIK